MRYPTNLITLILVSNRVFVCDDNEDRLTPIVLINKITHHTKLEIHSHPPVIQSRRVYRTLLSICCDYLSTLPLFVKAHDDVKSSDSPNSIP